MFRAARRARPALLLSVAWLLAACGGTLDLLGTTPTIYDLTLKPAEFSGKDVTAIGVYLWKPGEPGMSVLLPGVSTLPDSVADAQPIYASVECDTAGACKLKQQAAGTPDTGAVWLDNFPAEITIDLHRPDDSVWGWVEVTGKFESGGSFGPDGQYRNRMTVANARALKKVERIVSAVENRPLGDGKTTIFELADDPAKYEGQRITSQGYYFWSPATQGSFVEKVERERAEESAAGLAPTAGGIVFGIEGFPAEKSGELNVGPNGTFVWGLVEISGVFQQGAFGPDGRYKQQIVVDAVTVLEQPQE